jgi:predicted transposase YdaD
LNSVINTVILKKEALMNVNVKYKDSVFSRLFSDPETLRELYSAIEGIPLNPDARISINTLSNVLFMEQYNDVSFTIDNKLVILIEHQSTINPNMPVRLLLYIARVYEKIIERKKLYSETALALPRPEFIVLFNGTSSCPDVQTLRLSDCFVPLGGLKPETIPSLDLTAKVYNINTGHNEDIAKHCEKLRGYSTFIDKVREYRNGQKMPLDDAMKEAIEYCIGHNILSSFLLENSAEVVNMLLTEWNIDEAKEVWQEEAAAKAREKALQEGRQEGQGRVLELFKQGYSVEEVEKRLNGEPGSHSPIR